MEGLLAARDCAPGILAIRGMNQADRGRRLEAAEFLTESAAAARRAGTTGQEAWSQGVPARSMLLAGQLPEASRPPSTAWRQCAVSGGTRSCA